MSKYGNTETSWETEKKDRSRGRVGDFSAFVPADEYLERNELHYWTGDGYVTYDACSIQDEFGVDQTLCFKNGEKMCKKICWLDP